MEMALQMVHGSIGTLSLPFIKHIALSLYKQRDKPIIFGLELTTIIYPAGLALPGVDADIEAQQNI